MKLKTLYSDSRLFCLLYYRLGSVSYQIFNRGIIISFVFNFLSTFSPPNTFTNFPLFFQIHLFVTSSLLMWFPLHRIGRHDHSFLLFILNKILLLSFGNEVCPVVRNFFVKIIPPRSAEKSVLFFWPWESGDKHHQRRRDF